MLNVRVFNNIKIHTQYSICEGAIKIEDLASYCKNNKIQSIGICDSYNLCGALEFAEKVSKSGTQPIIGTQINFYLEGIIGRLPLFSTTSLGYKNLISLSSKSYLKSNEKNDPHCKINELNGNNKDLILLSGNFYGLFGKLFKLNKLKQIEELTKNLKKIFKDKFYFEIQRHNDFEEQNFESYMIGLSLKYQVPLIATQEVFYLTKDMHEAHDALVCIGQKNFINESNRVKYNDQHYLKKNEELIELFKDIPEALENNYNFPYRFNFKPKKSVPVLPTIKTKQNVTVEQELLLQANEGLKNRLNNFIIKKNKEKNTNEIYKLYEDRLTHEINIINSMNYSGYFLIVSDYIRWSKKNNIPVGPGRGSGAGSLVAYCLDITDIDPIEFDLIFERFLNPDRISMPDFDIDFCEEKRNLVFEYLKSKYKDGVAHIITFGKLKARMALRDVGRVLGLPYGHVDRISKMIPFDPSRPLSLQESIDREPRFKEEVKNNKKVEKLIELSLKLEGLNRNMATHAAGVVIAGENLSEQVPLYKDHSADLILPSTQFDMHSSENAGLVKFDILGLTALTVINKTIKMLSQKKINLDISKIDLEDPNVFKLLTTGETTGLFQLESTGVRETLRQMKPTEFKDIVALVALYRPGPMSNIPIYNECKNGHKNPDYIHETLEKILKPTYGIIIYQEQVMQIAQKLAGFTAGEADILRRAMGKKKRVELEKQKEKFVAGAIKNGIKKDVASYVFTKIEPFADYGFNKSHAVAYAFIAYQTAYLKTYYKEEFIAASMSTTLTNTSKLREYVEELKRLNVEVVRPSINKCFSEFKAETNKIFYGLGAIKSVGFEAISNIINEREKNGKFKSIIDFINRVNPKDVNKLQLEGLVKAGAFDEIESNRKKLIESIPKIISTIKSKYDEKISNQNNLFNVDNNEENENFEFGSSEEWSSKELLSEEFKSLGFYISDHPLNEYKEFFTQLEIESYKNFINSDKSESLVAGTIMSIQEKKSAKGTSFAIVKFSDNNSEFEIFLFSDILNLNREKLKESNSFILTLQKERSNLQNTQRRINIKKLVDLSDLVNKTYESVLIELSDKKMLKELNELLSKNGETKIRVVLKDNSKNYRFELDRTRKFDFNLFNLIKNKEYVKKISL
ncbi:MAG: DNA polymerase III subunit alpha [Pelagibacteraceae bacterium]|jgi:DNA polymerase III subunit alpha|nr:DNA polymerase III subunit alpha [Pelagibacteraceae bacterium]